MSDLSAGPPPVQPFGQPTEPPPDEAQSFAARLQLAQKAGGVVAPLLTVLLAFVMGGLVVLVTTGKNPLRTYQAIFEGSGLNWFFQIPWDTGSVASFNLQQTLIQTTTLILVGLAVAFAFRCGLFNIGGQGQYMSGAILAVWLGSSFEGMSPVLHVVLALVVGTFAGRAHRRDRRLPQGDGRRPRGDHDDHAQLRRPLGRRLPLRPRRAAPERPAGVGADLERHPREREAQGLVGRRTASGPPHRLLHRPGGARRLLDPPQPDDARLRRQGGRVQPGGGALRRDQRRPQLLPRDGDLRRVRRASPARSTSSAGSSGSRRATSRPRRSASSASPSHSSAATRRSGPALPRCSSARSSREPRRGTSTPRSSSPSSPST